MAGRSGLKPTRDELVYDPIPHTYTCRGVVVPGVTSCLDGLNDYSMVPADVLEHARIRGTRVHDATAYYDQGVLDWSTIDEEIAPYLEAWIRFREESGFTPNLIETRVFSLKRWYAGTLDRTGYFSKLKRVPHDEETMVDIKATAMMMPGTGPQTAAYTMALNEERPVGQKIKRRYGVQLAPKLNPPYRLVPYEDKQDENDFLCCLAYKNLLRRKMK